MPRQPRIEYAGGIYHVLSRGNRQEAIFADDADRQVFLKTLGEACGRTGWQVHAYVLMPNHYHLLLETPEANLVAGMQWLQGTYTQRFNSRHRLAGHLFQGRYKALLIEPGQGGYFTTVSTYVHLNPVRAGLVGLRRGCLEDYLWSSYPGYLKPACRPPWLCAERILGCHELEYRRIMEERAAAVASSKDRVNADPMWSKIRRGWYLGGEVFLESLLGRLDGVRAGKSPASLCGAAIDEHNERQARRLLDLGMARLGLSQERLKTLPKGAAEKRVLAWFVRTRTTVSNAWLATHLHAGHPANVPGHIRSVQDGRDRQIKDTKSRILKSED
jgi:putative transposase